jgi:L-methionine (R)-S-oxide reductase
MHSRTNSEIGDSRRADDKPTLYAGVLSEFKNLLEGERDLIANAANCSALLYELLPGINWAGFYFLKGQDLVLGPFQGKPACVRIGPGRGVCGAAAAGRGTIIVPNVHEFPGHIACDPASNSEIVVPLVADARLIGVLDIDSPVLNRFDQRDAAGLEPLVAALLAASDLPSAR